MRGGFGGMLSIRVKGGDRLPITEPEEVPFEITDWTKLKTHHAAIITRLNAEVVKALAAPDVNPLVTTALATLQPQSLDEVGVALNEKGAIAVDALEELMTKRKDALVARMRSTRVQACVLGWRVRAQGRCAIHRDRHIQRDDRDRPRKGGS